MTKFKRTWLAALSVCLAASGALAAVNGTHHDLSPTGTGDQAKEVCYWCHGAKDTATVSGYTQIGALCVSRCHGGGTVGANFASGMSDVVPARPNVANDDGSVTAGSQTLSTLSGGHQFNPSNLLDPSDGTSVIDISVSGFPYTGGSQIQCTSCHNVHDNTNTPFLRTDLFTGGPTSGRSFCERCHTARGNNFDGADGTETEAAPNGEHPVNVSLVLGAVNSRTLGGRVGRYIQLDDIGTTNVAEFDVTSANGTALNDPANHYTTGGKVSGFDEAADGDTFGCYTCHVTHLDTTSNLVARNTIDNDDATIEWNPLCVSCHGQAAETGTTPVNKNEQNPGLTNYYHPVGPASNAGTAVSGNIYAYTNSNGTFPFRVNLNAIATYTAPGSLGAGGVQLGANGKLLCTSCHDVHGGASGTMAIIDFGQSGAVCYVCHDGSGLPDQADNEGTSIDTDNSGANAALEAANSHHRTRTSGLSGSTFTDADGDTLNWDAPSWEAAMPTGDTFGSLADGLQCPDCHVFNGTAHNW